MASPGWLKKWLNASWPMNSPPLQLLDTNRAPLATAVSSAIPRFAVELVRASTSRMRQCGQIAETMSRSSDSSMPQNLSLLGSGPGRPDWFTMRRQPDFVEQAGKWKCRR